MTYKINREPIFGDVKFSYRENDEEYNALLSKYTALKRYKQAVQNSIGCHVGYELWKIVAIGLTFIIMSEIWFGRHYEVAFVINFSSFMEAIIWLGMYSVICVILFFMGLMVLWWFEDE